MKAFPLYLSLLKMVLESEGREENKMLLFDWFFILLSMLLIGLGIYYLRYAKLEKLNKTIMHLLGIIFILAGTLGLALLFSF